MSRIRQKYAKYQADRSVIILRHTILIDIDIYLDNPYNCILYVRKKYTRVELNYVKDVSLGVS